MKQYRVRNRYKVHNNRGFSLIELLVSIVILVLLMLPLVNHFYRSMQLNRKAEKLQEQTNLAASIMEGLKGLDMEETIRQFTGNITDFYLVTDQEGNPNAEELLALRYDTGSGGYEKVLPTEYNTLKGREVTYFAVNGIRSGGSSYDALIRMDSGSYRTGTILNNYPMPEAINLDVTANGILFSNGTAASDTIDERALQAFLARGEAYAETLFYQSEEYRNYVKAYDQWRNDYETAQMQGEALPAEPVRAEFNSNAPEYSAYCSESVVKSEITKTMNIRVKQSAVNTVEYTLDYTCDWPAGSGAERSLSYPVSVTNYNKVIRNIYLFYKPSIFKSTISSHPDLVAVENATPDNKISFYLAEQKLNDTEDNAIQSLLPNVTISGNSADHVTIYTNLDSLYVTVMEDGSIASGGYRNDIVKTEQQDRLYNIDIKIYESAETGKLEDRYQKELYSLSSTREN